MKTGASRSADRSARLPTSIVAAAVWLTVALGCASSATERRAHENLNSVLWVKTSVEYKAIALQSYEIAKEMLDRALEEPDWTAALEQHGDFADLPPAIVLDVDETVLDNSPYEAWLIEANEQFNDESWHAWCREVSAQDVPGALAFTRYAADKGVAVFYVTNRKHVVEDPTRSNLERLGFPLDPETDTILTRGEREEWQVSNKSPRRREVASRYRILLLVGDNIGDFVSQVEGSIEERAVIAEKYRNYWGRRWIVLPNPQYGSWEGALFGFDYGLAQDEKLALKHEILGEN